MSCKVSTTRILALTAVLLSVATAPSLAVTYDLRAEASTMTVPGGSVPVWGFAQDAGPVTVPGPRLVVPVGDTSLTVNLTNNLSEPVSIVIAGLSSTASGPTWVDASGTFVSVGSRPSGNTTARIRSFTVEVAPGGSGSFTWNDIRPGTYLYQSGTNVAKQVHMGLYGAMTHDSAVGEAYPGVPYDSEQLLVYSEIDPALHAAAGFAHPREYDPRYFLVNGAAFSGAVIPAGSVGQRVLLRFVNAGLQTYVPELQRGYMSVVAEDGSVYTYSDSFGIATAAPREQYSVPLPAGKTSDAIWVPGQAGVYNFFERRLNLVDNGAPDGGMLVKLSVSGAALAAANDSYPLIAGSWSEDSGPFSVAAADGVLANDDATATTAVLVSGPGAGTLTLNADGSFDYTPDANFNGTDLFTYEASDGTSASNIATVQLEIAPVNDTPTANADGYAADTGIKLAVAAPGVLGNDSDVDGDTLTASLVSGPSGGSLILNTDGSFSFTAGAAGTYTFDYAASDPSAASSSATVTITVADAANQAPVANDDSVVTKKNVPITFSLILNDIDADGTIVAGSVVVDAVGTQGGAVVNNHDGTVTFTPAKNFRGTDSFTYTVQDNDGATSNSATVRVSVVK